MVYGSKRGHLCSSQQVQKSDSSPARSQPGMGSEPFESGRQDEFNGITPIEVECIWLWVCYNNLLLP